MENGDFILTDEEEVFLHGRCHLFAIALSRTTGLPLQAYLDVDDDVEGPVLCHAFVRDGDHILDVRGRIPFADALDEFDSNEPWLVEIAEEDLMHLGSGQRLLDVEDDHFRRASVLAAVLVERVRAASRSATAAPIP